MFQDWYCSYYVMLIVYIADDLVGVVIFMLTVYMCMHCKCKALIQRCEIYKVCVMVL